MKRLCAIAIATLASAQALAVGNLADVSVTDRDTGETLSVYRIAGTTGSPVDPAPATPSTSATRASARLMAVTSVDGVNVITGESAGYGQSGYVFDSWAGYDITGWRKSNQQIAAFTFTSVPKSYAARTGRPENVGRHRRGIVQGTRLSTHRHGTGIGCRACARRGVRSRCGRHAEPRTRIRHAARMPRQAWEPATASARLRWWST